MFDYIAVCDSYSLTLNPNLLSVALYGLFVFYGLTRQELEGRRPLAKFLSIKLIVMFTFYQTFVVRIFQLSYTSQPLMIFVQFDLLEGRVIKRNFTPQTLI